MLLDVRDLHVRLRTARGPVDAVRGASFTVDVGRTLALVGPSGSGKSTLLSALVRILPGHAEVRGAAWFAGHDLLAIPRPALDEIRGSRLSIVLQEPASALDPVLTAGDQVAEVLVRHRRLPWAEARERVVAQFEEVGLPDPAGKRARYPHQLSGGERQRVAIAMALAADPDLLLADEPTASIDALTASQVLALLDTLRRRRGLAMVLVTHDRDLASRIADDVALLEQGRISGRPAPVPPPADPPARAAPPPHAPLLEVRGLTVHRGGVPVVRNVSLAIAPGRTLALVGGSGAGKTTLARAILRLLPVTSGTIRFDTRDWLALPPAALRAARRDLQVIFQDAGASLDPRRTVGQALDGPLAAHGIGERPARIASLLREVGLDDGLLERYPHQLSGGQRQRVVIARALSLGPRLLVCDEPISALDAELRTQILDLLATLRDRRGLAYLFVSHDLSTVRSFADEVAVMQDGEIVEHRPTAALFAEPRHPYTRQLLAARG